MSGGILSYKGTVPKLAANVFVAPSASVIGDVEIGSKSGIWFNCVVRGDVNVVRIGERTNIQDTTVIHVSSRGQGTFIGDDVTIGHAAIVHACTVEDRAFIGMRACVMDGARIESLGMVAAGALITPGTTVKSRELWAGSPARYKRQLTDDEISDIDHFARLYWDLASDYLDAGIGKPGG